MTESGQLLLAGTRLPVTASVLFVHASIDEIVRQLNSGVRGTFLRSEWGSAYSVTRLPLQPLEGALDALLPVTTPVPRRHVLIPTKNPEWTAVFEGSPGIGDQGGFATWLQVGGLRSLVIVDMPETRNRKTRMGLFAYRAAFVREPNAHNRARTSGRVVARNESGRWQYDSFGEWSLAADGDATAARVPDRLTHHHLQAIAATFSLRPFDADFYESGEGATLLTEPGRWEHEKEWSAWEVASVFLADGEPIRTV